MSSFATKTILNIKGIQRFEQLVLVENSNSFDFEQIDGVWDEYENLLEDKYESAFRGLEAIMNRVANRQSMSSDKFKDIRPSNESVKEYEFKYQDLRAYGIKIPNGKLVILGGYKNTQRSDINKFRGLKRKYLEFLKNTDKDEKNNKK